MPNKKSSQNNNAEIKKEISELDQLRHIVFGEAQNKILLEISNLRDDMKDSMDKLNEKVDANLAKLQSETDQRFAETSDRILLLDKTHDEAESNLQKNINQLSSEHEMFATVTQQDFKNIEQSLDSESNLLSHDFNKQLQSLKENLDAVSHELKSSKTDRKTLAKLLATMATNLEDDEL